MRKVILFLLCVNFLHLNAQETQRLRDSIKKYQFLNPNRAIEFGMEYVELRASETPDIEMVKTYSKIGEILLYMELYSSALEYFNSALRIKGAIKDPNIAITNLKQPPWIVVNIGNIYFQKRNLIKAKEKFLEAKELFELTKEFDLTDAQNGLNTTISNLGLIYGAEGDYDKQEELFYKVYQSRKSIGKAEDILYSLMQLMSVKIFKEEILSAKNKLDEIVEFYENAKINEEDLSTSLLTRNFGYVYAIFGAYYQSEKEYDKAIEYILHSREILKNFPVEINILGSRLSECYLAIGETEKAKKIALKNLNFKNISDKEKRFNYKVLEKIYKKTQNQEALLSIKDSLILIASGASSSKIFKTLNDLETQIILSDSARALNESKIRYNTYLYILIIGTVILFFSLVTIRVNYNYQKEKGSRLELEKEKVLAELDQKNRELVSKSNFIIQRNDYLKNLQKKIRTSQKEEDQTGKMVTKELNRVINSEKSYEEFDNMFVSVYPDFYQRLNQISKLSQTDLRLASYIKMNHNNNEIANISGISLRTVESQRYRLTKKLNLDKNQDLNSFLMSL
ncbi:MAG: hypothetical protein VWZ97_00540 [Flavobacteriaceae bacterium]|jgi:tetratricopeptide (TPR) repeat protein